MSRSRRVATVWMIALALAAPGVTAAAGSGVERSPIELVAKAKTAAAAPAAEQKPKPEKKPKAPKTPKPAKEKTPAYVHDPAAGPWDRGANWMSARVGYAKAGYAHAAAGNFGWGFGFSHMLNNAWAISGLAERNTLGKFGSAFETEMPFTIEFDRHFAWSEQVRPYLGIGGGTYYHKFGKTGADASDVRGGGFLAFGANARTADHSMLGLDVRLSVVTVRGDTPPSNPVFGEQDSKGSRWGYKVVWSVTY